jgi:two-component system, OmpR family, alkaline phosphatase synthesis response regulator PhoP
VAGKSILIIDDERDIHRALKAVLEAAGYTVSSALDSMQALMTARQVRPDLVILDIQMPGGGGFKVYERMRMNNNFVMTPILIYSAVPLDEIKRQIPDHANTVLLPKPAQPSEILAAVQKLLAGD